VGLDANLVRALPIKSVHISNVTMSSSNRLYDSLKKYQKYKGSGTVNTHRGFKPTNGSWLFPNYAVDSRVREWLYKNLVRLKESSVPFAIVENIDYLAADALTRVRIDLDVNLPTDDPAAFEPHLATFIDTVYDVLYEYTGVTLESDLAGMIVLLEKPRCTAREKGGFKHGAKLTLPYLLATHTDMLQLRILLLRQAHVWMPASWHDDTPALDTSIIDPCVYKANGWLMYGSQKAEQHHGGYRATRVWHRKGDVCPVADCDWTLLDLQRMLSIFCEKESGDDVQVLEWTKTPPELEQRGRKRKARATANTREHVGMSASVLSILTNILVQLGDATSVLTHESTEEDMYRYRVNRHGKSAPCANKAEHSNNTSILQLTTLFGRPVVKYICFSEKCGAGCRPVAIECPELAKRWAEAEASEVFKRSMTSPTTSSDATADESMPQEEEPHCYGSDIPEMPEEEEPEWYAGDTPEMPEEEEPEWYAGDTPEMPEEEEPEWYGGDIPEMPEEGEPEWYGGDIPEMPEEEEPEWYGDDTPEMPEEEEPDWYGDDTPEMPEEESKKPSLTPTLQGLRRVTWLPCWQSSTSSSPSRLR
jgi:hypothetical protein